MNKITIAIVAIAAIVAYFVLKHIQDNTPSDQAGQKTDLLSALEGQASIDPSTGMGNGLIDSLDNFFSTTQNPGGGEVPGSSETYTGATEQVLAHPINSIESIFGFNPN